MTGSSFDALEGPHTGERWADDAAAYAIGALDAEERAAFEAHLEGCAACGAEVRDFREVATRLAREVAGHGAAPSPALRDRIMAAALGDVALADVASGAGRAQPMRPRTATASIRAIAPARRPTPWTPWYAAAASLVLAAGLGAGWAHERAVRAAAQQEARRALRGGSARDSLLAALTAPDVRVARLAAAGEPAAMRLLWNPTRGIVVLTAAALPRPHAGKTYQLWGIPRGGVPQSLGVFAPEPGGRVMAVMHVPPEAEMQVAAVTEEPLGGSVRPSGSALMSGGVGAS